MDWREYIGLSRSATGPEGVSEYSLQFYEAMFWLYIGFQDGIV